MTSEAPAPRVPVSPEPPPRSAKSDAVIDEQLRKTQKQVKGVDIAAGLLTLGIVVIGYMFVLALADHWLVTGGLGFYTRLFAILILVAGAGVFAFFNILRPLLQKINPVFVAHTIEENQPSLKNSLVNFLLLRSEARGTSQGLSPAVYQAIEGRAASDLSEVSPEAVVERRHVLWLASTFVALVAIGGIYHIASPKSPLTSAVRIAFPWTDTAAPTRVTITDIKPGDAVAFHGETISISAEVSGVAAGEPVTVFFDTADGQLVGEAVPMRLPEGAYRYRCELPPGNLGLQQDLKYHLSAGDCRSKTFDVTVRTPPVIEVERIDYEFPTYTGIPDRSVERQGDIRAIEGTEITIFATANRPIQNAEIDLNCSGLRGRRMRVDDNKANGQFKLSMLAEDLIQPKYDCYQLRFRDEEGRQNRRPIRYEIEVIPDLPPIVRLVNPPQDHIKLPVNGALPLEVEAEDPDFALRKVTIRSELAGRSVPTRAILNKVSAEESHKGPFKGSYLFEPAKLGLKEGDQVVYWAEATDNKTPVPNVAETERRWVTIVEPTEEAEQEKQRQQDQQQQDQQQDQESGEGEQQNGQGGQQKDSGEQKEQQEGEGQQGEDQEGEGQEGQQQEGEGEGGQGQQQDGQKGDGQQQGDKSSEPIDGESNPGDVFDKALEHMNKQKENREESKPEQQPGEQQQGNQQPGEQQPGEQQPGEQQPGEQQPGEQQPGEQPGEQQTGEQQPGEQQPGEQQPGEQQTGEQQTGEQQPGEQQTGEQQPGEQQPGEQQPGEQQPGEQQPGEQQPGEQKPGEQQPGEQQPGEQQPGEQQPGEQQPGEQQTGEQQPGEQQPGEQQPGEQKPGEQQPGEQQPGEQQPGEQQPGEQQPGEQQTGEQQPGEQQPGEQQPGEQQPGEQQPGEQQPGEQQTGEQQPGEQQPGEQQSGEQQPGEQQSGEQQPGEQQPGEQQSGEQQPDEQQSGEQKPGEEQTSKQKSSERKPSEETRSGSGKDGAPSGKSPSDQGAADESPPEVENQAAEDFNKEYADKVTDLVLEEFEKQLSKQKPDQELLDSLGGWSREDLERFTKRWRAMKKAAKEGNASEAKRDLDDALQSLGLKPSQTQIGGGTKSDDLKQMREYRRIPPPKKWAPFIRATKRSIDSKTGQDRP